MAKRTIPQSFDDGGRPETPAEFSGRVQDQLDQDAWQGLDRVGNVYPEPAEIIEYPADDKLRVFRRKDGV